MRRLLVLFVGLVLLAGCSVEPVVSESDRAYLERGRAHFEEVAREHWSDDMGFTQRDSCGSLSGIRELIGEYMNYDSGLGELIGLLELAVASSEGELTEVLVDLGAPFEAAASARLYDDVYEGGGSDVFGDLLKAEEICASEGF